MRRLHEAGTDALPKSSKGIWGPDGHAETVFEANFGATTATPPGNGGSDLQELRTLLKNLGYLDAGNTDSGYDAKVTLAIKQFQYVNAIKMTGLLDNATINRLLNLVYDPDPTKGGMKLAKPSTPTALTGFDATATVTG